MMAVPVGRTRTAAPRVGHGCAAQPVCHRASDARRFKLAAAAWPGPGGAARRGIAAAHRDGPRPRAREPEPGPAIEPAHQAESLDDLNLQQHARGTG